MTAKNMMECDRCKKVFGLEKAKETDRITIHRHHDVKMDLCEACTNSFRYWVNYPERDAEA